MQRGLCEAGDDLGGEDFVEVAPVAIAGERRCFRGRELLSGCEVQVVVVGDAGLGGFWKSFWLRNPGEGKSSTGRKES